jgi:hypothetical protein
MLILLHKVSIQDLININKFTSVLVCETLGRPRRKWEDNIKMDLQKIGGGRGDRMELAQDRDRWRVLVGTVRNFQVS